MNPLDAVTRLLDPSGVLGRAVDQEKVAHLDFEPNSGVGILAVIPPGIVEVTRFIRPYHDDTITFYGPIVSEDYGSIRITVYGEPLLFLKGRDTIIRRPE